ncbi:MAG: hypothetical protein FJW31_22785 [Acidobacteria bacterium]|nr:hypothetical protein [Acidobacteriota bacterium]
MAQFQIYRMREAARQSFRIAAHTAGQAAIKPRDYEKAETVDAPQVYAAWATLKESEHALDLGDVLEDPLSGEARICKYVGFESAKWILPEVKSGVEGLPVANGAAGTAAEAVSL